MPEKESPQPEEFQPNFEKEAEIDIEPFLLNSDVRVFIIDDNPELVKSIARAFAHYQGKNIGVVGPTNPLDSKQILSRIAREKPEYFPHMILVDELFDSETYDEIGAELLSDILADENVARIEKPLIFAYSSEQEWLENLKKAGADIGAVMPKNILALLRSRDYITTLLGQYELLSGVDISQEKQEFYALHHGKEFDDRSQETADTEQELAILKELLGDEPQKVLDAGCGKGRISIPLAESGYLVTGVDLTPELLDEARQKSQEKNLQITWVEGNLANLESIESGSQDAVIFNWHAYCDIIGIRNQINVLNQAYRVLRPGGQLILDMPTQDAPGYSKRIEEYRAKHQNEEGYQDGMFESPADEKGVPFKGFIPPEKDTIAFLTDIGFKDAQVARRWETRSDLHIPKLTFIAKKPESKRY